jgi:peptidyl-prolyl cis-trans isomerase D
MLANMRENFTGTFALILLVIIGLSFVFFGLNYSFIGSSYAAKVDGEKIDAVEFEQSYRTALQRNPQLASISGDVRVQVRRSLLDQLVTQQVVDNYLDEQGYRISDEQIRDFIQETPEFQVDGKFDMDTYRAFLAERGYDPVRFEAEQRSALRQRQLQSAIAATAVVTPAEYRRYLNLVAEQRVVRLARIRQEDVAGDIEITEDMISSYYESNPDRFVEPESADISYIRIARDAVAEDIDVSEQALEDYYDANKDRYLQDERRRARHILILSGDDEAAAEEKARTALERVRSGEDFAEVAAEMSEDGGTSAQGGDLGSLTLSQLPGDLGSAIFSMEEGEVAGPVQSEFGFHVIRLDEIEDQGPLPLDQVRGQLLTELRAQEADDRYLEKERALSDALFDTPDMTAIAERTGLEVQTAEGFTRSGGEPFGSNQNAIEAVFDEAVLSGEQVSEVIELDADSAAIFKVDRYNPETRKPLDEVRDEVVAALEAEQAQTIMSARVDMMLAALADGEEFAVAAENAGLNVEEPRLITRTDEETDSALLFEVFAAAKPEEGRPVRDRVRLGDGSYGVFSLDAVMPGRPESIPLAERDQGKAALAQRSGIGDLQAFIAALRDEAKIVINDDVVAADDMFQ